MIFVLYIIVLLPVKRNLISICSGTLALVALEAQSVEPTDRAPTASAAFHCLARNIELSPYFVKLISDLLGIEKM
jgi:hypothetical protein